MQTQNTPVHLKLWNADFWRLALGNLFMTMAVYMQVPVLPLWLSREGESAMTGWSMIAYGIGLFALGSTCSYLVQRFRRNHVCQMALLVMLLCLFLMYLTVSSQKGTADGTVLLSLGAGLTGWAIVLLRFVMGASFGLAQMVLMSTLVIDVSESTQRTGANHSVAWFGRFAMSLGPVAALLIYRFYNFEYVLLASGVCCFLTMLFIQTVDFPFKAPEDNVSTFSLDRFFLKEGTLLFVNLLMITTIVGLLFSASLSILFYGMMMCGFFLALLAEKYMFVNADQKSQAVTGLIVIAAALLILNQEASHLSLLTSHLSPLPPLLVGFAIGIIGSRFQLFFIKLSHHCQRGTSQSTFFLAWETGIALGLFLGHTLISSHLYLWGIGIAVVALVLYNYITHPWYMKHKNR